MPSHFIPAKATAAQPEPAQMTGVDKHFARKEAKMQRKLAKVSTKLETLRFKHGIAASRCVPPLDLFSEVLSPR